MTIGGWILYGVIVAIIGFSALCIILEQDSAIVKVFIAILAVALIIAALLGMRWYFHNTASGVRAMTDQKSELSNGIERTITIYTADGKIIAQYTGKIDIEGNDGGYVLFDYDGKRYTYYNCFVESIANLKD